MHQHSSTPLLTHSCNTCLRVHAHTGTHTQEHLHTCLIKGQAMSRSPAASATYLQVLCLCMLQLCIPRHLALTRSVPLQCSHQCLALPVLFHQPARARGVVHVQAHVSGVHTCVLLCSACEDQHSRFRARLGSLKCVATLLAMQ